MQFDVKWVDVTENLRTACEPVFMFPVTRGHEVWAPQYSVLQPDRSKENPPLPKWSVVTIGQMVRVPLVGYRVQKSLPAMFAFGVQIGMAAIADLQNHTKTQPISITLFIGHFCTELSDAYECYVGMAIRTR